MPTSAQILRTFAGQNPPARNGLEGELAVSLQDAADPRLFVFGGPTTGAAPANKGWVRVNAPSPLDVREWALNGTSVVPHLDANNQALNPTPLVVGPGEFWLVEHHGYVYAFTGGVGTWGAAAIAGATPTTSAMFTRLSPEFEIELKDLDADSQVQAGTPANVGDAYALAAAAPQNFAFSGTVGMAIFEGFIYVLANPAAPTSPGSYINLTPTLLHGGTF